MTLEGYSCQHHNYKFIKGIEVLCGGNDKFYLLEYKAVLSIHSELFNCGKKNYYKYKKGLGNAHPAFIVN
jgi:hypothetical protein